MEFCSVAGSLRLIRPGPPNHNFNSAHDPEEDGAASAAEGQGLDPMSGEVLVTGSDLIVAWDPFCAGITVDARGAEPRSMLLMFNHTDTSWPSPFSLFKNICPRTGCKRQRGLEPLTTTEFRPRAGKGDTLNVCKGYPRAHK